MKSKISFAVVMLASVLGGSAQLWSQPSPSVGYVPYPQVLPGSGPVAPVQFAPVIPAASNPFVDDAQAAPQPVPPPTPPTGTQLAPIVAPVPIQAPAQGASMIGGGLACDAAACDSAPSCPQCGAWSGDCGCDDAWSGYGGLSGRLSLWDRLSGFGHGGLLSNAWCRLSESRLCRGGFCLGGYCFGDCCPGDGLGLFGRHGQGAYPRPTWIWGEAEYLLWWNKNRAVPVLATTSVDGTPFSEAGVLGASGTSILFGGGKIDNAAESGFRLGLGLWLTPYQTWGIGARYMNLGPEDIDFSASSTGSPILARPFYNISLGQEDSVVVAYPGVSSGQIQASESNEVRAYEVYLRKMLYYGYCNRVDLILGYQNTQVFDTVAVRHRLISEALQGPIPLGTEIDTTDRFRAKNDFHGGEIGILAHGYDGRVSWNLLTKLGLGNTRQSMTIQGQTITTVPDFGSSTSNQGLLALDSNSGVYEDDEFTLVPEASLSVAYNVTDLVQLSVGYSMLYWTSVLNTDGAIDDVVNPTQINGPLIGPARPSYSLGDDGSFWVQALTFGVSGRF